MTKTKFAERREASREAAARLDAISHENRYAKFYEQYADKLASDDPFQAGVAREILLAYDQRDWPRLARAKNLELLHVEWLPNWRVRVDWPWPIQLSLREWEAIAYHHDNKIYVSEIGSEKIRLFDRRVLSREFHRPGDSYSSPLYEDLVVGFEVRDSDYFDFCRERQLWID